MDCGDSVDCGLLSCMGWVTLVVNGPTDMGGLLRVSALRLVVFYSRFFLSLRAK